MSEDFKQHKKCQEHILKDGECMLCGFKPIKPLSNISLRDYFAGKVLPSVIDQKDVHDGRQWSNAAWISYQIADAMLAARGET
jgi:hypothetical protein